jgi:hypothetical protein
MGKKITDEVEIQIRDEYIHGFLDSEGVRKYPTIEALAKRHDVAYRTLSTKAKASDWQGQKNRYQTELKQKLDDERMQRIVDESKRLDDTCIQLAMGMLNVVGRKIQKHMEEERSDPEYEGIPAHVMSHLSATTANAQKIGKLALGEAQEISKVAADVSNPDAFRAVMEQLDELAAARSQSDSGAVH